MTKLNTRSYSALRRVEPLAGPTGRTWGFRDRRQTGRRGGDAASGLFGTVLAPLSRRVVDSAIEASRARFATGERQSPVRARQASTAYGQASRLDEAAAPCRKVTI